MCRHLAYVGPPVAAAALLVDPPHGLAAQVDAPRHQDRGITNRDGWGVAWSEAGAWRQHRSVLALSEDPLAAASLGASRLTIFRRITLPSLTPAIAAGAALSFARGVSEYGSLVLLSGNLPMRTEVTSVRILSSIENDNLPGAAAVATILLVISLLVIVILDLIQRRVVRRG